MTPQPENSNQTIYQTTRTLYFSFLSEHRNMLAGALVIYLAIGLLAALFSSDLAGFLLAFLLFIFVAGYGLAYLAAQRAFWKKFAEERGWQYEISGDPDNERAFLLYSGHSQFISHIISGTLEDRPIRIFSYMFSTGSGKNQQSYRYTVFGFKFSGQFPHLYLNRKDDQWGQSVGETISLPAEFEKVFKLHAPRKYEIEALQIFTPTLLSFILDSNLRYDIELVNQELLVFKNNYIRDRAELDEELRKAKSLADQLAPILDHFRFEKIGDHPTELVSS